MADKWSASLTLCALSYVLYEISICSFIYFLSTIECNQRSPPKIDYSQQIPCRRLETDSLLNKKKLNLIQQIIILQTVI